MRPGLALGMALALRLAVAPAFAEPVAIARAVLRGGDRAGSVFFLAVEPEPGTVAVGSAHAFDRTALAESGEVRFVAPGDATPLAVSHRYFARPGEAYARPGATLRDDYLVFALDAAPRGVRRLEPAAGLPQPGEPVRVLGAGAAPALHGVVATSGEDALEVEIDATPDLRGWGGAPVLDAEGRVVGLLQSAWPHAGGLRLGVGPIAGVVAALAEPLEGGVGRLFATLAPPPSAATSPAARRRAATGSPFGDVKPARSAAEIVAAATRGRPPAPPRPPPPPRLAIEQPPQGAVIGDAGGAFVAGRAAAFASRSSGLDVMVVVDTSASTAEPTGVDVDGDGRVGTPRDPDGVDALARASTDPGDSILAAEVEAARRLIGGLDPRHTRVGLVSFAGEPVLEAPGTLGVRRAALTEEPLTSDYARLGRALDAVRERGAHGATYMAAGVDQATLELLGLPGSISRADPGREKVVLFFTDGEPTLPFPDSAAGNVGAVIESAVRARRADVRIHAFAIGPEALAGPVATVEMAAITAGLFTPVREPGSLSRFMELVRFARVETVEVRNATTGASAYQVRLHPDGSWDALVPLAPGENRIEVVARGSDGQQARADVTVRQEPGAEGPVLPVELVSRYNDLLEGRLSQLEWERAERMRKELVVEIERERAAALERAERQRKELDIEPWQPPQP